MERVAAFTLRLPYGVNVMQHVTGMTERILWGKAIIVFPILAKVLMRAVAQERNLGSWKASSSIQNTRF